MDINRYSGEISMIRSELKNIANGDWYEITGNKRDGSFRKCAINAIILFDALIDKITNDKEGIREKANKIKIG